MPLSVRNRASGPYLIFKYRVPGQKHKQQLYLGNLYLSATPILDAILDSVERCTVEELIRLRDTPKYWRPIRRSKRGTNLTQSGD